MGTGVEVGVGLLQLSSIVAAVTADELRLLKISAAVLLLPSFCWSSAIISNSTKLFAAKNNIVKIIVQK